MPRPVISSRHVKDGVSAKYRVFHNCGQRSGNNHAGEHCLVKVSDQFLKSERYRGDRCVEGRRDTSRHPH